MFATFAEAGVDMVEPTIVITDPPDGTLYAPGEDVIITVDPWDDVGGYGWQLTLEDPETGEVFAEAVDYDRALEFKLVGVPEGSYRAIAMVQDHADHITTDEILFTVGTVASGSTGGEGSGGADDSSGTNSDSDSDSGSGSEGSDGSDDSNGAATDGADTDAGGGGANEDSGGCGCTHRAPTPDAELLWFPFALLCLRRRR